jgi:tetratricopeptide (TPR) repeat protein
MTRHIRQVFKINFLLPLLIILVASCGQNNSGPSKENISQLYLKQGEIISCGPPDKEFGTVDFRITGSEKVKNDFNLAVELLHSFEYDESEKVFAKIIDEDPQCAMAYWGVAMCNFHPLWEPPSDASLQKGSKAVEIAQSIKTKSEKELGFINAVAAYYQDWNKTDPHTRCVRFEKAMGDLYNKYPQDNESAIFYALALDAAAEPTDKSYTNQRKAGAILDSLYTREPNHPGIIHYIIHTYDYPDLAILALPAARRYAGVAPSSAHAQHMPSHIFTRLGLWDECIKSNLQSVSSANCYAQSAGIKGHWDEELHGLDYLVYAYLQMGRNDLANKELKYLETINEVYPLNFKVAYAFAAIPARITLENKNWNSAAGLQPPQNVPWNKFPWQEAIIHFARLLGSAHNGNLQTAKDELAKLNLLHDTLQQQRDGYRSNQVQIQIKAGEAWINLMLGKKTEALNLIRLAADMEDSTTKHPVTPCEVVPARELYADMLLQMQQYENALQAYDVALKKNPNRFNSLYGAGLAAERLGNKEKATRYYKQLSEMVGSANCDRNELAAARGYLLKGS